MLVSEDLSESFFGSVNAHIVFHSNLASSPAILLLTKGFSHLPRPSNDGKSSYMVSGKKRVGSEVSRDTNKRQASVLYYLPHWVLVMCENLY